ncbi:protein GLUTAMINE DUMPER 2-like [Phragmites australis]|uniref:protein GLUTAMINE DUMPER 2-like n=1 Tax=Phragmites australis TaxID=29695 RepID=UPI002D79368A|nr:protein GLUTAMINE DUMPER 2-like [Phragmites australis]
MWPAGAEHPMAMGHGPAASSPSSSATFRAPHSPWQSPVPYLFGGLAAMLGLIALSLLALACSYWKLSGSLATGEPDDLDHQAGTGSRSGDGGEKGSAAGKAGRAGDQWREHVVVIMAGDERPTFLATPASGRADEAASRCGGISEEGVCVECGASAPSASSVDDELRRSERGGLSGSSVISRT